MVASVTRTTFTLPGVKRGNAVAPGVAGVGHSPCTHGARRLVGRMLAAPGERRAADG